MRDEHVSTGREIRNFGAQGREVMVEGHILVVRMDLGCLKFSECRPVLYCVFDVRRPCSYCFMTIFSVRNEFCTLTTVHRENQFSPIA